MFLLVLFVSFAFSAVCNSSNPADTPFTTGCDYCVEGTNQGCANGGICYRQLGTGWPDPLGLKVCGCLFGYSPPQCAGPFTTPPLCNPLNSSQAPPSCAYCDPTRPVGSQGCANNGTCYYETRVPGAPPTGVPLCGCGIKFSPPTCTFPAPVLPFCDPNNASSVPPTCNFCDPTLPQGQQGCYNGGTCYYQPLDGVPPPGLAVCGCSYEWAAPSCFRSSQPRRICDPTNVTDIPSQSPTSCQFCYPGAPTGSNGCSNFGFCRLSTVAGAPPNFQLPICACQPGRAPPQCFLKVEAIFGADYTVYRWCFFAGAALITVFGLLVVAQHLYYGVYYRFTEQNKTKFLGAVTVVMSAVMNMIWLGTNPAGAVYGYNSAHDVRHNTLTVYFILYFICVGFAINTSNWIWIGLSAVSPMRRQGEGWPWSSHLVTWCTVVILFVLCLFFGCFQAVQENYTVFIYIAGAWGLALCAFSVLSGVIVIATIKNIDNADPKLLFRTALQLSVTCAFQLIGCCLLIVVVSLPPSIYTTGIIYYGVSTIFPILVEYVLQVLLLLQFRIAVWQLKEVAAPRANTMASASSSARKTANSYTDSMSKGVSGSTELDPKRKNESVPDVPVSSEKEIEQGVVTL